MERWVPATFAAVALLATAACAPSDPLGDDVTTPPAATEVSPEPPTATAEPTPEPSPDGTVASPLADPDFEEFPVDDGDRPHDVAPGRDGLIWYTAQRAAALGRLDPATGEVERVDLGSGAAPHGVIVGDDGDAWVTDGGLNAIVRVDHGTLEVTTYPLPRPTDANLNTAAFDGEGRLWFTGQSGVFGWLDPATGEVDVFDAPRGAGPYGITATPDGTVWFSSLAGSYIARIDSSRGEVTVVDVPSPGGGARRIWSDSTGDLWVTEWFAGDLARYDPVAGSWSAWPLPGDDPSPYAVYVDDRDMVWITDFGADALVRFDPATEEFRGFPFPTSRADVRQLLGVPGEVWGAGSATDTIIVLRTR